MMVNLKRLSLASVAFSSFVGVVYTHPGEENSETKAKGIAARDLADVYSREATKCSRTVTHRDLQARAAARRSLTAQFLREERGVVHKNIVSKRDQSAAEKWMKTCHDQSSHHSNYSTSTPEATIFTSNATHALTPETIIGPYFVAGELMRKNITETQAGIPLHLDLQFIDINTCQPVPNMLIDIWHANALGIYSGVAGSGGLNTSYLRGVQVTSSDGVVQFDTIYPGHYFGRTNHIHVVSRRGGQILPNGTYLGGSGTVNHIGQLYFDQQLTTMVEAVDPYKRNWFPITTNSGDFLIPPVSTSDYDPFLDYVMLSDDANDGLLMWASIGVNATADYNAMAFAAATWYSGGGAAATFSMPPGPAPSGANGGGPPMGGPPMGGPPMGGPPVGTPSITGLPTAVTTAPGAKKTPNPWGPCKAK